MKKRKLQDESHGGGEPVWKLKLDAHLGRKALRDGERLAKKVDSGKIQFDWLPISNESCQKRSTPGGCMSELIVPMQLMGMASRGRAISKSDRERTCVVTCPTRCEHICELCRDLGSRWSKQWCRAFC